MDGKVKWFSTEKGYGFIVDNDELEYYFHVRDIKGADLPSNGDSVSFESTSGPKGPKAITIVLAPKHPKAQHYASHAADDRETCSSCGKRMIPRIITGPPLIHWKGSWTPVPKKSICPFCGATHMEFPASFGEKLGVAIFAVVFIVVLLSIISGK